MASGSVINVCFHGIGTPERELEPGEDGYWVDTDQFLRILDEIATWPSVRLSFDDGNASDLRVGLPALAERGMTGEFFALAGRLRTPGSLDADGLRELNAHGMAIGTHGMYHRPWSGLTEAERYVELVEARHLLAAEVGTAVETAACPLGRYDRRLLAAMRRLRYTRVFTSDRRIARGTSWLQPRFSVRRDDTPESMRATVLTPPRLLRRAELEGVGLVKRLR
jgi:peptidoglycan/xylan/chitin deacetylase (PgdA/CDA1 family)